MTAVSLQAIDCGPGGVTPSFAGTLMTNLSLSSGRIYDLYVPASYNGNKRPLVLVMHGHGGSKEFAQCTGIYEKADAKNFLVASLQGLPCDPNQVPSCAGELGWNAGIVPNISGNDDLYVQDVITDVPLHGVKINPKRIYAAGFSNGAMMAYRLAADLPTLFAAVGVVEGTIGEEYRCDARCTDSTVPGSCVTSGTPPPPVCGYAWNGNPGCTPVEINNATGPITVAIVHGKLDNVLHADGSLGNCDTGNDPYSLQDAVNKWVAADGCTASFHSNGKGIDRLRFADCLNHTNVVRYFVDNLSHEWPNRKVDTAGKVTVADLLWKVFGHHHLN